MTRKEFLQTMWPTAAIASAALSRLVAQASVSPVGATNDEDHSAGGSSTTAFRARRVKTEFSYEISAPPQAIFPLLCPVREYDWIDGWQGQLVYSDSGVAEDNCIFTTDFHGVVMTWSAVRYEPPTRIAYLAIAPGRVVMHINIDLESVQGKTRLHWTRVFTGLSEQGNQDLGWWTEESEKKLGEKLEYYLRTGKMLLVNPKS